MYFANPTYLWGLLGLLVPIFIHLWSNRDSRVIKVGSIKMFTEGESRNSRSFRLNEIWLLLLRGLIIAVLVLIMAELRVQKDNRTQEIAYYFEESILNKASVLELADSLSAHKPVFLFKEGLPVFEKEGNKTRQNIIPDYWKLAKSLEKEDFDSAVVFSSGYLNGLKGKRPIISKNINWITVDLNDSTRKPLVLRNVKDSLQIVYGIGNSQRLFYEKELIASNYKGTEDLDSIPEIWIKPFEIQIFYDDSLRAQAKYFRSAINAIQNYTGRQIEFDSISQEEIKQEKDLLIWLSNSEVPDLENKVLQLRENEFAEKLIVEGNVENKFFLTQNISAENILDHRLSEELLKLIIPSEEIYDRSSGIDKRKISEGFLETGYSEIEDKELRIYYWDLSRYLWILLFVLLIGERILAKIRRQ